MAKLAINILIEKRKKLEKDSKIYSTVSFLLHALLIALIFLFTSYSNYKKLAKPKIYKVAIATLPSLSTAKGLPQQKKESKEKTIKKTGAKKSPKKKDKKVRGINTKLKRKNSKKTAKSTQNKTEKTNNKTKQSTNGKLKKGFGSPASSIMDLDTTSFDYSYYLAIVRDKVGNNWIRTYTGSGKVKIYFKIMKNGEIKDATVEISSGNTGLDKLALQAVLKSNPLPPLPEGFREEYIGIHIWFNYEE